MTTLKSSLVRALFGLAIGITSGELLAQRVTEPIATEYFYFVHATREDQFKERGPIEKVNTAIPGKIKVAAEQLTGILSNSNKLSFSYYTYSPERLSFGFSAHGRTRASGSSFGKTHHTMIKFYPLCFTSDHYSAYAHGFFVFADFIKNRKAIIRVELDMDLVYDDQASVTRIKNGGNRIGGTEY